MGGVQINEELLADSAYFADEGRRAELRAMFKFDERRVILGEGALAGLAEECARLGGGRVFLIHDPGIPALAAAVRSALDDLEVVGRYSEIAPNPSVASVDDCARVLAEAEGFFDFYLKQLCGENDTNSDRGRRAILRAMGEAVRKTNDEVMLDRCAQQTALVLRVSAEAVRAEFGKLKVRPRQAEPEPIPAAEPLARPDAMEFWLLRLLFEKDTNTKWLADHLELEWIGHADVREIVSRKLASEGSSAPALLNELDEPKSALLTEALSDQQPMNNTARELSDFTKRLRARHIDGRLARLTQQLAQPGISQEDQTRLMSERRDWLRRKAEPVAA